ncbi:hypothetical protein BHE74_00010796 [Ensete ventricosum]|nr:hypothetical protein BHE74_00010796 [Ensete ventricosum]
MLIQVLDDSDDEAIQILIRAEVSKWCQRGANIVYRHRLVRTGYKAGNLKSAMSCDYVQNYEFVAIFDADFQPNPDFLKLTIPHFKVKMPYRSCVKSQNLMRLTENSSTDGTLDRCTYFACVFQILLDQRSSESDLLAAAERESKSMMSLSKIHKGVSESELGELSKLQEEEEKALPPVRKENKIYKKELALAFLLLVAAARSLLSAQGIHFYFLLFQGVSFLVVGLDLIGEQMS